MGKSKLFCMDRRKIPHIAVDCVLLHRESSVLCMCTCYEFYLKCFEKTIGFGSSEKLARMNAIFAFKIFNDYYDN